MQQTCKIFFLKYYNLCFFYKIITICINIIILFSFLSSCNILFQNPIENFILIQEKIREKNRIKKYHYKIDKKEQKIHTLLYASGVNPNEISILLKTDFKLNHLEKGQKLSWKVNSSGQLLELQWKISNFEEKTYKNIKNNFLISNTFLKDILIKKTILIEKNSNFFQSALQSGLKKLEINNVIQSIQTQVDFQRLHIGSVFTLIFSHDNINKKNTLLGVKLNNFGKKYYFIRASNGFFYDLNGFNQNTCPINLIFLKKYRISSEFNLHRLHPITHHITRHLGVDFAMPQGTPVLATSNGKIIKTSFDKIAGFYITLKNKNNYITRYMHLKKILVKLGDNIKIGQKIALSGNTGRTTGPHLHYEIWINHHAIDPIKFKCILYNKEMTKKEKKIYLEKSKKILENLQ